MFLTRVVSSLFILQISYVDAASEFLLNDFLAVNIAPVTWSDFKLLPSLSFGGYLPDGLFFFWGGAWRASSMGCPWWVGKCLPCKADFQLLTAHL